MILGQMVSNKELLENYRGMKIYLVRAGMIHGVLERLLTKIRRCGRGPTTRSLGDLRSPWLINVNKHLLNGMILQVLYAGS